MAVRKVEELVGAEGIMAGILMQCFGREGGIPEKDVIVLLQGFKLGIECAHLNPELFASWAKDLREERDDSLPALDVMEAMVGWFDQTFRQYHAVK